MADTTIHSTSSSYREMVIKHVFLGSILQYLWERRVYQIEVLESQVDDSGYDLVLEINRVVRHIQLKSSVIGSATSHVNIHTKLGQKPSGCVIWLWVHPETLRIEEYGWYGKLPTEALNDLDTYPIARHSKGNAQGIKAERPSIRRVPKSAFTRLTSPADLAKELFGDLSKLQSPAPPIEVNDEE